MVKISGNTYPVKDQLKALGARWDANSKCWTISETKAGEARKLVESAPAPKPATPGTCRQCGESCKAPYTLCWPCKSKSDQKSGKCAKCHDFLSAWERQHGMRLCADCRDGGSRARGGMSYYDRHGRFVLGDDD